MPFLHEATSMAMHLAGRHRLAGLLFVGLVLSFAPSAPRSAAAPFEVADTDARFYFDQVVGATGIYGAAGISVTAPVTIKRVRPWRASSAVELVAVRAAFVGRGWSPSGHRMFPGAPGVICTTSWPIEAHGPTYPVEGLRLAPKDQVSLIIYARSLEPGRHVTAGVQIDYRTPGGRRHSVQAGGNTMEMYLRRPGDPPIPDHDFVPCRGVHDAWTKYYPHYPP